MTVKRRIIKPACSEPQVLKVDVTKLYAPAHYAEKMGFSRTTLYEKIKNGQIHPNNVYDANGTCLIYHP